MPDGNDDQLRQPTSYKTCKADLCHLFPSSAKFGTAHTQQTFSYLLGLPNARCKSYMCFCSFNNVWKTSSRWRSQPLTSCREVADTGAGRTSCCTLFPSLVVLTSPSVPFQSLKWEINRVRVKLSKS